MRNPLAHDLDHVLAQMGRLWEDLRGARLFITGGTGFFGCWLLETLLWANDRLRLGASLVVLTRNRGAFAAKAPHLASDAAVAFHTGDVRTFEFPVGEFSHVVHAGMDATTQLDRRDPRLMLETMLGGTRHTLEFARACGASRFLLASSGSVYGRQRADLAHVPEDYAGAPDACDVRMVHGEGKRASEMLCAVYADSRLTPTVARCFAFHGPYLPIDIHFAIGNFIRDAMQGGPIRVAGDGTPYRSYLYGADLAAWLWTILLRGESMRPYNVGSDAALTIEQLARLVGAAFDPVVPVTVARAPVPGAPPERYVPAITRATNELGLRVTVPLEDGIRRTVEWHTQRTET
ncbi:MAG TPA: NAD-dependent epimerase/dehydratase family protein [Vicinamibacterales bacterium]|jgi:dTDP-glucose 4,6-dehydratase|nr:NAD-dependent epimerase/dehydratase family protein [Vicinamibacterales bacterium]